jgi:hypothetical protein
MRMFGVSVQAAEVSNFANEIKYNGQ